MSDGGNGEKWTVERVMTESAKTEDWRGGNRGGIWMGKEPKAGVCLQCPCRILWLELGEQGKEGRLSVLIWKKKRIELLPSRDLEIQSNVMAQKGEWFA